MNKVLKKVITCILTLSLTLGMVFFVPGKCVIVKAAGESLQTATEFDETSPVDDMVTEECKTKYYKYVAKNSGYVKFSLTRTDLSSTNTPKWSMTLYDGNVSKVGYNSGSESPSVQTVMVDKGTVYYLTVENYSYCYNVSYRLTAVLTECKNVITESSDKAVDAVRMTPGEKYYGVIDGSDDVDYVKIKADKSGYYSINLNREDYSSTDEPKWRFGVLDSAMHEIYDAGTSVVKKLYYVLSKGQYIYIRLKANSNTIGVVYSLDCTFKAKDKVEKESNNSFGSANKITPGKTYYGVMADEEGDYFCFKASSSKNYRVKMSLIRDVEYGYIIKIYDSSHKLVASTTDNIYKSASVSFKAEKGKKYYIFIDHAEDGLFGGRSVSTLYKLKVSK